MKYTFYLSILFLSLIIFSCEETSTGPSIPQSSTVSLNLTMNAENSMDLTENEILLKEVIASYLSIDPSMIIIESMNVENNTISINLYFIIPSELELSSEVDIDEIADTFVSMANNSSEQDIFIAQLAEEGILVDGTSAVINIEGCTNQMANNYDSEANLDDGTCDLNNPLFGTWEMEAYSGFLNSTCSGSPLFTFDDNFNETFEMCNHGYNYPYYDDCNYECFEIEIYGSINYYLTFNSDGTWISSRYFNFHQVWEGIIDEEISTDILWGTYEISTENGSSSIFLERNTNISFGIEGGNYQYSYSESDHVIPYDFYFDSNDLVLEVYDLPSNQCEEGRCERWEMESANYQPFIGCTDVDALNYHEIFNEDDETCIYGGPNIGDYCEEWGNIGILDCDLYCSYSYNYWLGNGWCDDNFNCAEFNYDEGDCMDTNVSTNRDYKPVVPQIHNNWLFDLKRNYSNSR